MALMPLGCFSQSFRGSFISIFVQEEETIAMVSAEKRAGFSVAVVTFKSLPSVYRVFQSFAFVAAHPELEKSGRKVCAEIQPSVTKYIT